MAVVVSLTNLRIASDFQSSSNNIIFLKACHCSVLLKPDSERIGIIYLIECFVALFFKLCLQLPQKIRKH